MASATAAPVPRALVIGAGPMADYMHLPILSKLQRDGQLRLVSVCDLDQARAANACRKFGFLNHGGDAVRALERPDIEVVYIFADARTHYQYGLLALAAGKHVFVEKPVAPSFAEAQHLVEEAERGKRIAVGGHNRRFYQSIQHARVRAGMAGWAFAEAFFHKPLRGRGPDFGAATWLSANGIHALDALVFLMGGLPTQVTALTDQDSDGPPHRFSAIMRWPNGSQGTFLCNNSAGVRREEYVLHASGETCQFLEEVLRIERDGIVEQRRFLGGNESFVAEHKSFLVAVRTGVEPPHSLSQIVPSLFLGELIESGFSGPVVVPSRAQDRQRYPGPSAPNHAILVVGAHPYLPPIGALASRYRLVSLADLAPTPAENRDIVGAILGTGVPPLTNAQLDRMPCLAAVGIVGLSVARHRPEELLGRGITLLNARASYAVSVAEFALGLAILARRRAFASHEIMRHGGWGVQPKPTGLRAVLIHAARLMRPLLARLGLVAVIQNARTMLAPTTALAARHDLATATVGLIGWSANARSFTAHLLGLGATVLVYSEHAPVEDIARAGAQPASFDAVLAADIVSLHRGLTKRTRHCLGTAELARLRPGSVLINIARGGLVDPDALFARLRKGDVFACLDTFDNEPLPASHKLRKLPNVFLTSHIAGGSPDMHAASAEEVVSKLTEFLEGRPVDDLSREILRNMT